MPKPPSFLIADNPLVDDGQTFVVHLRAPVVVAQAIHYDSPEERISQIGATGAILDYLGEYILLYPVYIAAEAQQEKLPGLMRRMADWYHAYLVHEDSQEE